MFLQRDKRRGFTLVELMVVVVIIGVLLVLMLPGYQGIRAKAKDATCRVHLGQMGRAALAFAAGPGRGSVPFRNGGAPKLQRYLPFGPGSGSHGVLVSDRGGMRQVYWMLTGDDCVRSTPFALASDDPWRSNKVFMCPSSPKGTNVHAYNYRTGDQNEQPLSSIKDPSRKIMFIDFEFTRSSTLKLDYLFLAEGLETDAGYWHDQGTRTHAVMWDGSVRAFTKSDFSTMTNPPGSATPVKGCLYYGDALNY